MQKKKGRKHLRMEKTWVMARKSNICVIEVPKMKERKIRTKAICRES
jgi:hypothetical protein